jgi:hypothetical protein
MNRIPLIFPRFKKGCAVILLCGTTSAAYAVDQACWADFFEEAQYAGKHLFIEGATQLADLKSVNGESWDKRIHSLKVGPKAKVTVYENPNFELTLPTEAKLPNLMPSLGVTEQDAKEDSELIFIANSNIHDLGDFNFHKKIRSLKIECL